MGQLTAILCGAFYLFYVVKFSLSYWFNVGDPLDLEEVFIAMMCLGAYLANRDQL